MSDYTRRLAKKGDFIRLTQEFKKHISTSSFFDPWVLSGGEVQVVEVTQINNYYKIITQPSIWSLKTKPMFYSYGKGYFMKDETTPMYEVRNMNYERRIEIKIRLEPDERYCQCDGPTKENWADGKKFIFCTKCKKERLIP